MTKGAIYVDRVADTQWEGTFIVWTTLLILKSPYHNALREIASDEGFAKAHLVNSHDNWSPIRLCNSQDLDC
jgi:hypothetical protein